MKRNPAFRRPPSLTREDIRLAKWLMGDTLFTLNKDDSDIWERGAALLSGIGRERPLPVEVVANLLSVDQETLRKALASSQFVT